MNEEKKVQKIVTEYPYREIEVTYENKSAGITLSGTLTLPLTDGPFPVVMLVAGMGPVDRDGTNYYGHKPFFVLADHLTRQGIAVLRIDKRGVGKSTGVLDQTVTCQDLANDVLAGIEYLKTCEKIDINRIGLIGHSEGGLVATIVAAHSNDIAFVILMAGAVANDVQSLLAQTAVQLGFDGASAEMIKQDGIIRSKILELIKGEGDIEKAENQLKQLFTEYWVVLPEDQKRESELFLFAFSPTKIESRIKFMNSAYYRFMLTYDSFLALANINTPLLALYGGLDFMAPEIVFPYIKSAMEQAGNRHSTIIELPMLNHSFQTAISGAIEEYATIKETIAPVVLQVISDWIFARVAKEQLVNK